MKELVAKIQKLSRSMDAKIANQRAVSTGDLGA